MTKIRVILVEDSPIAIELIRKILNDSDEVEVVGTATNGVEALPLIDQFKPDVICLDYSMPKMDGLQLAEVLKRNYPCPILVISNAVHPENKDNIFSFIQTTRYVDFIGKPNTSSRIDYANLQGKLIQKIKVLAHRGRKGN